MTEVTDKVERAIARFERVTRQLDERGGPGRDAARRERQRLNAGMGRTVIRVAVTVAVIWLATIAIGLVKPIGMFGFLAALLVTGVVAGVLIARGGRQAISGPAPSADLPNGAMVERFDSYLYRARGALPAPARIELDAMSRILPSLKQTLERVETLDPSAQDARRLMSVHLPGLIERYERVPAAYRNGMARTRPSTSGWSRGSLQVARRWRKPPTGLRGPTWPRWRRKAGSSSHATASRESSLSMPRTASLALSDCTRRQCRS